MNLDDLTIGEAKKLTDQSQRRIDQQGATIQLQLGELREELEQFRDRSPSKAAVEYNRKCMGGGI